MTGSVALDVVIGLVFTYLLYSLFATVLMEIANSFFGLRARNLRYTIRRMLMDEKDSIWLANKMEDSYWKKLLKTILNLILKTFYKLANSFIKVSGKSSNLSDPGLFQGFYNQPTIKYLSAGTISNKPSYISSQNFSKALVDTIKSNFNMQGIFNKLDVDFDILNNSFDKLADSSELKQEFNILNDDQKNFKDWFNTKDDLEKLRIATALLPTNLSIKSHLQSILDSTNKDFQELHVSLEQVVNNGSPIEKIKAGITMLPEGSSTRKHIESLLVDANFDFQKFKFLLEQWFDDTMERSAGWFKRRVQYFLLIIGFILAVSFNADTLDIIKKLSNDPKAREQLVQLAIEYSKENKIQNTQVNSNTPADDTIVNHKEEHITKSRDSLQKIANIIQADIYKAQNIISSNWKIPNTIETDPAREAPEGYVKRDFKLIVWDSIRSYGKLKKTIATNSVTSLVHESLDMELFKKSILPTSRADYTKGKINVNERKYKWYYVFARDGWNFKHLWGYLLTALAISLGSPFWFDLLNKLIKLRNAVKPIQQKANIDTTNNKSEASLINRVG